MTFGPVIGRARRTNSAGSRREYGIGDKHQCEEVAGNYFFAAVALNNKLYFSTARPDMGFGDSDIYVSDVTLAGSFGRRWNLAGTEQPVPRRVLDTRRRPRDNFTLRACCPQ